MLDIAAELERVLEAGHRVGVVTVAAVHGSAPRAVGSAMAVTDDGQVIGAISGGCVESEAHALASAVLDGDAAPAATLGLSDDDALAAGLSCGGHLSVIATVLTPADAEVREQLRAAVGGAAAALDLALAEGTVSTTIAADDVATRLEDGVLHLRRPAAPRLIIVGAVDFSSALATAARPLGYRITVVDARPAFATAARHPDAHEVIRAWPGEYLAGTDVGPRDVICVLTHEERFDIPALAAALATDAAYVGAMGSRRTDVRRRELLREAGVDPEALARLRSPIGLDLGAVTPAETAISIVAEIVADARASQAPRLSETVGPIHAGAALA
ncbi:XdhC family protein [Demequina muriae]|uniref:XdhC family protein n=1 Tax=Demequina muriae TaxID=3051664 RepID=A0ABT8GID7_9MICO|nr:XdhC/CoxI family protein [Demequina sp. EGI L300058]MDN4481196.1 XdhC family protein [Demequina sp. EGI L300058]